MRYPSPEQNPDTVTPGHGNVSIHRAGGLILAILLGLAACSDGPAGGVQPRERLPVAVQTLRVETTRIPRRLSGVGSLESPQTTQLSAEFGGKVVFLDIPEGKEVAAGHVLARLDEEQAEAALTIARARHQNERDRLARLRQLRTKGVISEQELDDAVTELDAAGGELADARVALRKTAIRAPFAGVLGLRQVSLGAYLDAGDPIVRITQIRPLELVFSLPERHVSSLAVGQTVRGAAGSCEQRFADATITVIDPYIDPATRSVRLQATLPNEAGRLRPGMAAALRVEVGLIENALLVPQEAIVREGTRTLVYVLKADGTASPREVELGEFFTDRVQIVQGLDAGMEIVAAGQQKLRPGAKVVAEPYMPVENPNLALGSAATLEECEF